MQRNFPPPPDLSKVSILGRAMCYDCFRPSSHCVCNFIKPFEAHCNTLILQHPHERKKYYSTSKLLRHAITNSRILRGVEFDPVELESTLEGKQPYLLFPHPDGFDCAEIALGKGDTIIAIDGTWREAQKIVYRSQFLKKLPCVTFHIPIASNYKIRKQPRFGCLSTLESIGHLLKINAVASGQEHLVEKYESLFEGFNRMVSQQLNYWPARPAGMGWS